MCHTQLHGEALSMRGSSYIPSIATLARKWGNLSRDHHPKILAFAAVRTVAVILRAHASCVGM